MISCIDVLKIGSHETTHKHLYPSRFFQKQMVIDGVIKPLTGQQRVFVWTQPWTLMSKAETMLLVKSVIAVMGLWLGLKRDW